MDEKRRKLSIGTNDGQEAEIAALKQKLVHMEAELKMSKAEKEDLLQRVTSLEQDLAKKEAQLNLNYTEKEDLVKQVTTWKQELVIKELKLTRTKLKFAHFEESQYDGHYANGLKKLKRDAVPTVFAPVVFSSTQVKGKGVSTSESVPLDQIRVPFQEFKRNIVPPFPSSFTLLDSVQVPLQESRKNVVPPIPRSFTSLDSVQVPFQESENNDVPPLSSSTSFLIDFVQAPFEESTSIAMPSLSSSTSCVLESFQIPNEILLKKISELEDENAKLKVENEKLKLEIAQKNKCLSFLSEEQIAASIKGKSRKHFWSNEAVTKGLKLRFALGKFGYNFLLKTDYPAPSYSTLNRRIKNIPVNFGVLMELLHLLRTKVDCMDATDKFCAISIDEMEIDSSQDFDTSNKSFVGKITLGSAEGVGNHYTVVLLRGLKSSWKQIVAHEITGGSCSGSDMYWLMQSTISAVRDIGLSVKATVSDMGSKNQAMWNEFGVCVNKKTRETSYTIGNSTEKIHSVAYAPHLIKNLRSAFLNHELIVPQDAIDKHHLPSKFVNSKFLRDLWKSEIIDDSGLRLLHHLSEEHLYPHQYTKMNVASAVQLFSIKTAAALETAVRLRELPKDALTTAWFVREVNDWFKIMSARHCKEGITINNQAEKFEFLNNFIHTIQHMTFNKGWKPVQTGIIMSTISVMNVASEMFSEGCTFFLPSRLSQDGLENVFSQIRRKAGLKPTALQAKRALKLICISEFVSDLKNTNYFTDSDSHLLSFSKENMPLMKPKVAVESVTPLSGPVTTSPKQENDIHYIAGAALAAMLKKKFCSACKDAIVHAVDDAEPLVPQHRTLFTEYCNLGGLRTADSGVYRICREAERWLQRYKENLTKEQMSIDNAVIASIKENCSNVVLPTCCNIKEEVISYYLITRCKAITKMQKIKKTPAVMYSSASSSKRI